MAEDTQARVRINPDQAWDVVNIEKLPPTILRDMARLLDDLDTYVVQSAATVGLNARRLDQPGLPVWDIHTVDGQPARTADIRAWVWLAQLQLKPATGGGWTVSQWPSP